MGDLVTQIQDQINFLASQLYNLTGTMQRDAPPQSLSGEPALDPPGFVPGFDAKEQAKTMAEQILDASKMVEALVDTLPDVGASEEEQLARIADLHDENVKVGNQLDTELVRVEKQMEELQEMFGMLADRALTATTTTQPQTPEQQQQQQAPPS